MRICYNAPAMVAHNALTRNDNRLTESLKRLSSGLKVTEAKDNPAGMAMGKRMNMQLKGLSVATQNSSDAISAIETADGALSEVHDILQRMNVLAVKASNGPLSDADRATVEDEITQLKQEITRIADTTQFNGNTLMNGNFDLRGYTDNAQVKVGYYSDAVTAGKYVVNSLSVTFVDGEIDLNQVTCGLNTTSTTTTMGFPTNAAVTKAAGNKITIVSDEFELNLKIEPPRDANGNAIDGPVAINTPTTIDVTGIGAMTMQIGSNEGQVLDIRVPTISLDELGLTNMNMKDMDSARAAIDSIAGAIEYVSSARSRLGAYQNRLEHCVSNLDIISENMTAAYSRIMDADMAEEMTEYTTVQVISQASMSMLAQANERPAQVLQLLQ
ncbi:MAG: flagellin FliC3 [Lachnospiraceae bacterium]|jgi:flagellin|nr:flagellin FliC3 [Lachnospiraceae bacterium]MCI9341426.1 flagellin FliC3 [Lachnospiraceae bacterium]GFH91810.1 flagellin D [Lachnospiraceae bacterium]